MAVPVFRSARWLSPFPPAEQYADGQISETQREIAYRQAKRVMLESDRDDVNDPAWALRGELISLSVAEHVSAYLLGWLFNEKAQKMNPTGEADEKRPQCNLLRDLFGPLPFRPIQMAPEWLSSPVTTFATSIYQENDFSRMAALGDKLERAGCSNSDILTHCRSSTPHNRGCWVVDLILEKK
jgi:hypothetical protein